jgi:hypothetical protein
LQGSHAKLLSSADIRTIERASKRRVVVCGNHSAWVGGSIVGAALQSKDPSWVDWGLTKEEYDERGYISPTSVYDIHLSPEYQRCPVSLDDLEAMHAKFSACLGGK